MAEAGLHLPDFVKTEAAIKTIADCRSCDEQSKNNGVKTNESKNAAQRGAFAHRKNDKESSFVSAQKFRKRMSN